MNIPYRHKERMVIYTLYKVATDSLLHRQNSNPVHEPRLHQR